MRLFNRRREMEFDDPRLVGMTPLKATEETFGPEPQQNLPTLTEERSTEGLLTLKRSNGAHPPDKCRMTNVSTWKRVSRPWDSLRRTESSEQLCRSVISNRRKTLHFYPDSDEKQYEKPIPRYPVSEQISLKQKNEPISTSVPPKKKIGRVESLRLLLSKSNRIYRGRNANSKQDKGTDTEDLENDLENFNPPTFAQDHDDVFHSKYSSISSLKSDSFFLPISSHHNNQRFHITKTISCENLSINNKGNQGITLPGHRDMSTSTSSFIDSSCSSQQTQGTTAAKRSSFPHAYIRSRLSSLQEEPKNLSVKSARVSSNQNQDQKPTCSLASNFMHKGFYHSMGNLLSETKEEGHQSDVDGDIKDEENVQGVSRMLGFDPLKQIRIDLLHRNPSELEDQSPSPTFWGRRSYSIGDILEKRKVGKADNGNGVEESGYDSDSTRNGHESPRNSVKSPSSETENDLNESEQCAVKNGTPINKKSETESFDSQSQANSENSESSSTSTYSFPASGCLITINQQPTPREVSVNGFRKVDDGSVIEITSEIDQSEDVPSYSSTERVLGPVTPKVKTEPAVANYSKSSSNVFVSNTNTTHFSRREQSVAPTPLQTNKETSIVSIRKEMSEVQKTAPSLRLRNRVRDKDREWNSIKPSRSKSLCLSIFTVCFNKGPRKKSLGFSVIGGKDSPVPGIFVKRIFPYGQASEEGGLTEGDEILSVNGQPLANSTHAEALNIFKSIKEGDVVIEVARREFLPTSSQTLKRQYSQLNSKSCEQLHQAY